MVEHLAGGVHDAVGLSLGHAARPDLMRGRKEQLLPRLTALIDELRSHRPAAVAAQDIVQHRFGVVVVAAQGVRRVEPQREPTVRIGLEYAPGGVSPNVTRTITRRRYCFMRSTFAWPQ